MSLLMTGTLLAQSKTKIVGGGINEGTMVVAYNKEYLDGMLVYRKSSQGGYLK